MHSHPIRLVAAGLFLATSIARAEEPPLRDLLRDGLFAEEVSRDPEAAAKQYEQLLTRYSEERDFAASALFRLAEVRRKQDRKDDAILLYQRLLTEFPGAATEAKLARENLAALGGNAPQATPLTSDPEAVALARLKGAASSAPDLLLDPQTLANAAANGWSEVVDLVLKAGSRPYEGYALAAAVQAGNLEIIKQLLAGGDPVPAKLATEAILAAIGSNRFTVLEFLLDQGLKPGKQDIENGKVSLLLVALQTDAIPSAEILLKHGVDINEMAEPEPGADFRATNGTALHQMIRERKFEAAAWLLDHGAKPDLPDPDFGLTPLHVAAAGEALGTLEIMEKLLAAGADPNHVSADREAGDDWTKQSTFNATPLETAIARSMAEQKVKLLLKHGADPNRKGSRAGSMLATAISIKQGDLVALVNLLGEAGLSMDDPKLLQTAMQLNQPKLIAALLNHGADPNVLVFDPKLTFREPVPLISNASVKGDVELLKILLAAGADLKTAGPNLIQDAATSNRGDTVGCLKLLAAVGAVPDEKWKDTGYRGVNRDVLHYLTEQFRIPELIGGPDIHLLIDMASMISTSRIAEASVDAKPPDLVSLLLAKSDQLQLPIGGGSRGYQWSIVRKGEDGEPVRMKVDFFLDAPVPELRWGDLIVCELLFKAEGNVEFRNGLSDDLIWALRQRISFPITVEIEGRTREITVKGRRLVFDPTKNEVPLVPLRAIVGLLWQPPSINLEKAEILVSREGWPDIHLSYYSDESGRFQLRAGDRVKLELSDEVRQTLAKDSRDFVRVRMEGYPFNKTLGNAENGKLIELTIPSLIQALVDIQVPRDAAWADLAGNSNLGPEVWANGKSIFGQLTLFPHPDLSHIRILRSDGNGGEKRIEVDLAKVILAATDALTSQEARKSDVMLQAGDTVEIPVLKDKLDTPWKGFSARENAFFAKALAGRLQVTDETGNITVRDIDYRAPRFVEAGGSWIPVPSASGVPSARAWWQARDRISEVLRDGVSIGRSVASACFLRDGDAIRLNNSGRSPRPRIEPPPSR